MKLSPGVPEDEQKKNKGNGATVATMSEFKNRLFYVVGWGFLVRN